MTIPTYNLSNIKSIITSLFNSFIKPLSKRVKTKTIQFKINTKCNTIPQDTAQTFINESNLTRPKAKK